ncbi:Tyrosine-protein kinase [Aphelenchoides besseyi]|nr:Tyrosine-protein kinase [Aphelenchoides besseyi]
MNNNTTPAVAQIGLSVPASQPQTPIAQSTVGTETELQRAPFFHGLLPREDIKTLLREPGEFLVRSTEPKSGEPRCFVLSVMIKHFLINRVANNQFAIDSYCFDTIPRLVNYHLRQKVPVSRACSDSIIRRPVVRQSWELMHEDLEITKKLGEGAFGEVSFGRLRLPSGTKIDVAIKLAKLESMRKEQIKEIMNESRMMRPLDHPNIKTYGVAALREPLLIVMEFASRGGLDGYLRKNTLSLGKKIEACADTAFGLEYLHSKNCIHRDISARNCLVKISDFGLTREGPAYQMQFSKPIPIRWTAVETLRTGLYTFKSDVWSYGILCWEIFNKAAEPYLGMNQTEVSAKVKNGYRLSFSPEVPVDISNLIVKKCWLDCFSERPTMTEIAHHWERVYAQTRPKPRAPPVYTAANLQQSPESFASPAVTTPCASTPAAVIQLKHSKDKASDTGIFN